MSIKIFPGSRTWIADIKVDSTKGNGTRTLENIRTSNQMREQNIKTHRQYFGLNMWA